MKLIRTYLYAPLNDLFYIFLLLCTLFDLKQFFATSTAGMIMYMQYSYCAIAIVRQFAAVLIMAYAKPCNCADCSDAAADELIKY